MVKQSDFEHRCLAQSSIKKKRELGKTALEKLNKLNQRFTRAKAHYLVETKGKD